MTKKSDIKSKQIRYYQFYFIENQSAYIITCKNFKFLKASVKHYTQFPYTAGSKARKELTQLLSLRRHTMENCYTALRTTDLCIKDVVAINSLNLYCILLIGT